MYTRKSALVVWIFEEEIGSRANVALNPTHFQAFAKGDSPIVRSPAVRLRVFGNSDFSACCHFGTRHSSPSDYDPVDRWRTRAHSRAHGGRPGHQGAARNGSALWHD